jgi:septal ring factor EnvC (AmiA/AmiB activator)
MYLLASKDINQLYARYVYLRQYKEYRRKKVEYIIELKGNIEKVLIELKERKQEKVDAMNELLTEKSLLVKDQNEVNNIINVLKREEDDLIKQIEEKRRMMKKLEKEIEELIRKEASKSRYDLLTPEDRIISDDFVKNKGRLPWPTEKGVITDHFGEHEHPIIKNLKIRNNGIDITTIPNSEVRAIFQGEVSKIFTIKGTNATVIIRHGNYYTVYHNLINVRVKIGDIVSTKADIGEIFYDEKNTQSILHFELWKELEKQNPEEWLSN